MSSPLRSRKTKRAQSHPLHAEVRALPERTLKRESEKAWAANKRWKQEKRPELEAWYEGYGAAIDWMLQVGKRPNDRAERPAVKAKGTE